jgi:transposase
MGTLLTPEEREKLLYRHRGERDRRSADRIKAVLLRDEGMSHAGIARVLFLSEEAIRKHLADYEKNAKLTTANGGSEARLNEEQTQKLLAHLDERTYVD